MKTLNELNEKTWYRMAKVFYGGAYLLFLSAELYYIFQSNAYYSEDGIILDPGTIKSMIIFTVVSLVIYEAIRRAFYYVIFRTPFPKKK